MTNFAFSRSVFWAVLCIVVGCQLSNAQGFLDRLRSSEHLSSTERSLAHHVLARGNKPTEKAKHEHRQDIIKLQRSQSDLAHRVVFSVQHWTVGQVATILESGQSKHGNPFLAVTILLDVVGPWTTVSL